MKVSKSEREKQKQEAIDFLRKVLPAGSTVYTVLKNVSRSGMSRDIAVLQAYMPDTDAKQTTPTIDNLSWYISHALDRKPVDMGNGWAVRETGCGMDMGFHLVYSLGQLLHESGYALNQRWL